VVYFINKLVFSELRMAKWLVWCSEVTACLGIRNNWIPGSALPRTLSRAFILSFSHGNGYRIDLLFVSRIILNFCRRTFQVFCLQSGDTCDCSFQRFLECEKSTPALLQQELNSGGRQGGCSTKRLINVEQRCVTAVSKWMSDIHQAMSVSDVVVRAN